MKLLVVAILTIAIISINAVDSIAKQSPQEYEEQSEEFVPSVQQTNNSIEPIDDRTNEINKGQFTPIYRASNSPSSSSTSTQLKQVVNSANYSPVMTGSPTPIIMHYLPQNQMTGGLHYLQLIPTRPLIVPISPYLSQLPTPYSQQSPTLSSLPAPSPSSAISSSLLSSPSPSYYHPSTVSNHAPRTDITNSSPLAVLSRNNRYFRPNVGVEMVSAPKDLSLNTNEYIPERGNNIAPTFRILRGRRIQ